MKPRRAVTGAVALATALTVVAVAPPPAVADTGAQREYTVVADDGVDLAVAVSAIAQAGGTVVDRNDAIGLFRVASTATDFVARADASPHLVGAAHRTPVGRAPGGKPDPVEREGNTGAPATGQAPAAGGANSPPATGDGPATLRGSTGAPAGMDPLDDQLWGLRMIGADRARTVEPGSRKVSVGILDTGVDASHPDIAPNFSRTLSRNFAADIPEIDGPCEVASCLDPVGTDDGGHGTHVAGTIGAAANGGGVSGVAPNVTLVELKGGQDSGYFFVEPVVNALTYAADAGIDVVNMSFYVDPWLFNCTANPADSAAAQAEQRTILAAVSRALRYAHRRGVTLVAALGNEHQDLGTPLPDASSPDYPGGTEYPRVIDNGTCLSMPTEGPHVIGVSALGPSGKKADYSNYGTEQTSVSAPGGFARDYVGTPDYLAPTNRILSTYPVKVLQEDGRVDADGNVVAGFESLVLKACTAAGACGYYTYLQGTSMASPHAAGVAALIVSRYGHADPAHRDTRTLAPDAVERVLLRTATEHACPDPPLQTYTAEGRPAEFNALCVGDAEFNGFYGYGIVNAYAAVTAGLHR